MLEQNSKRLYLKLVPNDFGNDSRDKRELSVAKELGYDVLVVATTKEIHNYAERYDGYDVYRISTRRLGNSAWLNCFNRGVAFLDYIFQTIRSNADIVSGHDYITLLAAYIANKFKSHKVKLIYDSHEFELYRYAPNRTEFQRNIIKVVEGFLIRRVDLALMVGDKIADGVQEIYHLKTRPTVVRNIPQYWHLVPEKSAKIRSKFLNELESSRVLLMYHGGVTRGRGIEYAVRAIAFLPEDTALVVLGNEMGGFRDELKAVAEELGVRHRVLFHPAVSMDDLKDYIGAADVELVLQSAQMEDERCLNIEYSLPNKFFESIQSCVPLICCDLPEMGKIVRKYDIGLLVKEDDEKSVAEAVLKLRNDKTLYDRLKRNMERAKEELCWEKESLKLKMAIQGMIGKNNREA